MEKHVVSFIAALAAFSSVGCHVMPFACRRAVNACEIAPNSAVDAPVDRRNAAFSDNSGASDGYSAFIIPAESEEYIKKKIIPENVKQPKAGVKSVCFLSADNIGRKYE